MRRCLSFAAVTKYHRLGGFYACAHALSLCRVQLFAISWTVALQAPLAHEIFPARILERVTISYSRGSPRLRDQTCNPCSLLPWQADSFPLRHLVAVQQQKLTCYRSGDWQVQDRGRDPVSGEDPVVGLYTASCVLMWWKGRGSSLRSF